MSCNAEFEQARSIQHFPLTDKISDYLKQLANTDEPGTAPHLVDNSYEILRIGIELRSALLEVKGQENFYGPSEVKLV